MAATRGGVEIAAWLDVLAGLALAGLPFLLGVEGAARWTLVVGGLAIAALAVWTGSVSSRTGAGRVLGPGLALLVVALAVVVAVWALAAPPTVRWIATFLSAFVVWTAAYAMRESENVRAHVRW